MSDGSHEDACVESNTERCKTFHPLLHTFVTRRQGTPTLQFSQRWDDHGLGYAFGESMSTHTAIFGTEK